MYLPKPILRLSFPGTKIERDLTDAGAERRRKRFTSTITMINYSWRNNNISNLYILLPILCMLFLSRQVLAYLYVYIAMFIYGVDVCSDLRHFGWKVRKTGVHHWKVDGSRKRTARVEEDRGRKREPIEKVGQEVILYNRKLLF